jgi:hypothetical protein
LIGQRVGIGRIMANAERLFTRGEANGMLPQLRPLLEELRDEWARIKTFNPELQKIKEKAIYDAYSPRGAEYVESISHLIAVMGQVQAMGVLVKDLDRGLCDFPYLREDRVVYLCWHLGEESIEYWHDVEAGFQGREPLDERDV